MTRCSRGHALAKRRRGTASEPKWERGQSEGGDRCWRCWRGKGERQQSGYILFPLGLHCCRPCALWPLFSKEVRSYNEEIESTPPPMVPPPPPYSECCKRLRHITADKWDFFFSPLLAHWALIIHINAMSTCMPAHT